jgi:hypothetical protein
MPLMTARAHPTAALAAGISRGARALAKRVLPRPARRAVRELWQDSRNTRDRITALALGLRFLATLSPLPRVLLFFGLSPGDDLLCTAVLHELRERGQGPLLMISNHGGLFDGNADVAYVRPAGQRSFTEASTLPVYRHFVRIWGGEFRMPAYAPFDGDDRSEPPSRHIIADLCASTGITGPVEIRPYFTLSDGEKAGAAWAAGRIAIQSSGMGARHPMQNKQWYEERFQEVVDGLCGEFEFIQLGSTTDPALQHVKDVRGATGIREAAAILHNARLYVGSVGLLMHLARAVECPSVIVFGGREAPWQSGYVCNLNLYSAVPCAPCWRWNSCDFDRKCMSDISVDDVISAIRQILERPRQPLDVERIELS